jgi:hypothetical protein
MGNMHRPPHNGEPTSPWLWATQRILFNEPFVASVLGISWPHPDPSLMPPARRVYDGLGGSVVAWEADDLTEWVVQHRPDRLPHLYLAFRRHLHSMGIALRNVESEFEARLCDAKGLPAEFVGSCLH